MSLQIWDPLDNNNNVAYSCRRVEQIQYICTITVERLSWFDPNHYSSVLATVIDPSDQNLRLPVHQVLPFVPPECGEPPKSTTTACTGYSESCVRARQEGVKWIIQAFNYEDGFVRI